MPATPRHAACTVYSSLINSKDRYDYFVLSISFPVTRKAKAYIHRVQTVKEIESRLWIRSLHKVMENGLEPY